MTEAPAPNDVSFECDLAAPPQKVWRALTEPDLRAAWLGEAAAEACEVIEAAPPERLVLKWSLDAPPSTVIFEIRPDAEGGSHLAITHRPAARLAQVVPLTARIRGRSIPASSWRMAA